MWPGGRCTKRRGRAVVALRTIVLLLFITLASLSEGNDGGQSPRCQSVEPLLRHRPPQGLLAMDYHDAMETILAPTTVAESPELAIAFHAATGRSCVLDVFSTLFRVDTARTVVVRSDWEERLENATASLAELYNRGVLFAFRLGENLLWRNVSFLDYSTIASRVKATLPELRLYATETLEVFATGGNANGYRNAVTSIPSSVDFITATVDREDQFRPEWSRGELGDDVIGWLRWVYESFVYPKLHPHQRIIPKLAMPASGAQSAARRVELFESFISWAATDARVGGATHIPAPEELPHSAAPCYERYLASLVDRRAHHLESESSSA